MATNAEHARCPVDPTGSYKPDLYVREDKDLVDIAIRGTGGVFKIFFGLRRFGKTWFLHRVEDEARSAGIYTAFIDVPASSISDCAIGIERFANSLRELEGNDWKALLLIDDLEAVEGRNADEVENLASCLDTLVEEWGESGRLRIILCEPTNFAEWLSKPVGFGHHFEPLMRDWAKPAGSTTLRPLSGTGEDSEAHRMVSKVGYPVSAELAATLADRLGGNPWILAHATRLVARNGWTEAEKFEAIDATLNGLKDNEADSDKLGTIYGSLSEQEQFLLRIILSANKNRDGGQSRALFRNDPDGIWKTSARAIEPTLVTLGLVKGSLETGYILTRFMAEYLDKKFPDYSLFENPRPEDKKVWSSLLAISQPKSEREGKLIIHQLSDLFLSADHDADPQWDSYVAHLASLHRAFDADKEGKDERPDFIIICGNIAAAPGDNDIHHRMDRRKYLDLLRGVEGKLSRILPYLRRGDDARKVIILPGVFDLYWGIDPNMSATISHDEYRKEWASVFSRYSLAGEQQAFPEYSLTVLAYDTTHLDGAKEHGGTVAVGDLIQIRGLLQNQLRTRWSVLNTFHEPADRAKLSATTLGYILDVTDEPETFGQIDDPTFKWKGTRPDVLRGPDTSRDPDELGLFLSDTGFVSARQRGWTENVASADNGFYAPITIAVTHHHPNNPRRSGVIEFFNESHFREALAKAKVRTILHGRSSRQQILKQTVTFREKGKQVSPTIDLIGSGSFSRLGCITGIESADHQPNASFNEIIFIREPSNPGAEPQQQVNFWEYDAESRTLVCANQGLG